MRTLDPEIQGTGSWSVRLRCYNTTLSSCHSFQCPQEGREHWPLITPAALIQRPVTVTALRHSSRACKFYLADITDSERHCTHIYVYVPAVYMPALLLLPSSTDLPIVSPDQHNLSPSTLTLNPPPSSQQATKLPQV